MYSAVLDSNVLASGVLMAGKRGSPPAQILSYWRRGTFELVSSEPIVNEVERTLSKPYFMRRISRSQVQRFMALLSKRTKVVELTVEVHGVAVDPDDDPILATALSAKAEYLVTGDQPLLRIGQYEGVRIISPRQFLEVLIEDERNR